MILDSIAVKNTAEKLTMIIGLQRPVKNRGRGPLRKPTACRFLFANRDGVHTGVQTLFIQVFRHCSDTVYSVRARTSTGTHNSNLHKIQIVVFEFACLIICLITWTAVQAVVGETSVEETSTIVGKQVCKYNLIMRYG